VLDEFKELLKDRSRKRRAFDFDFGGD